MTHRRADIHDDCCRRNEQRGPRRIGAGGDEDLARFQLIGLARIMDDAGRSGCCACAGSDALQHGAIGGNCLPLRIAPFPRTGGGGSPMTMNGGTSAVIASIRARRSRMVCV
ncbi:MULTISPECIES: hypothetical protein [unclassified Rhodococcus (in: high G+C Gram-positive bacteria)]|uniref:hypothetical protein n=1 Tax=unclassified Rhodococcus (in: high G+C Gram-positive bacteria) TaxID=192944 RepID=UPI002078D0A4|nr:MULTISPECIES: hypothetical protein [unclassified Rhodococcus (in: high G+C Gram-positive bacteria)]